jgi:hypothetical protein
MTRKAYPSDVTDAEWQPLTLDLLHRTATFSPIRRIVLVTS